jgi:hypothetical protein
MKEENLWCLLCGCFTDELPDHKAEHDKALAAREGNWHVDFCATEHECKSRESA